MGFGSIRGGLQEAAALVKVRSQDPPGTIGANDRGHRVGVLEQRR